MSNYEYFVRDFPGRCGELLMRLEDGGMHIGREVTVMLTLAMPLIVVPLERLKAKSDTSLGHPSRDWERFCDAKSALDALRQEAFVGSILCPHESASSWCFGHLKSAAGRPDGWSELENPVPMKGGMKVKSVLTHIRNALAHGNIATQGRPSIDRIVFVSARSEKSAKFNYLTVSPADFRTFLSSWAKWLNKLPLPEGIVPVLSAAA